MVAIGRNCILGRNLAFPTIELHIPLSELFQRPVFRNKNRILDIFLVIPYEKITFELCNGCSSEDDTLLKVRFGYEESRIYLEISTYHLYLTIENPFGHETLEHRLPRVYMLNVSCSSTSSGDCIHD